jgi:selenocysteine-specific elongation factor
MLAGWLETFHKKDPAAAGAPIAQARLGLEPSLAALVFENNPAVRVQGEFVSLSSHSPQTDPRLAALLSAIEGAFAKAGLQPPPPEDVLKSVKADPRSARDLLERLIKAQRLVRVAPTLVYHSDAIAQLRRPLEARKGKRFSVPEFKEWTNLSRKHAIPLLEYFDHQRVTRREGDLRLVL